MIQHLGARKQKKKNKSRYSNGVRKSDASLKPRIRLRYIDTKIRTRVLGSESQRLIDVARCRRERA